MTKQSVAFMSICLQTRASAHFFNVACAVRTTVFTLLHSNAPKIRLFVKLRLFYKLSTEFDDPQHLCSHVPLPIGSLPYFCCWHKCDKTTFLNCHRLLNFGSLLYFGQGLRPTFVKEYNPKLIQHAMPFTLCITRCPAITFKKSSQKEQ